MLRAKGGAVAYKFAPEPDLPSTRLSDYEGLPSRAACAATTPAAAREVLEGLGASAADARALVDADVDGATAEFFSESVARGAPPSPAAAWLLGEVAAAADGATLASTRLTPGDLADLLGLLGAGELSRRSAKDLLPALLAEAHGPVAAEVDARGLRQISDAATLDGVVAAALAAAPKELAKFRSGAKKLHNVLLGKAMAEARGTADPAALRAALDRALAGAPPPGEG